MSLIGTRDEERMDGRGITTAADTEEGSSYAARPRGWRSRLAYRILAWLMVACIAAQVFLAGMAVFVNAKDWDWHVAFVHTFEYVPILMFILSLSGRMTNRMRAMTAGLFVLIELQYALIQLGDHVSNDIAALHPVNALLIFWLAIVLARRAEQIWRNRGRTPESAGA